MFNVSGMLIEILYDAVSAGLRDASEMTPLIYDIGVPEMNTESIIEGIVSVGSHNL